MAARPPPTDIDDEPDIVEFGIAALEARLDDRDVTFPITADELVESHGDVAVAVDAAGHEMTVAEALDHCPQVRFESKTALLDALHPVFEAERESLSNGILSQLRALVPF